MLVNLLSEEDIENTLGVSIYGLRSSCEHESIYKEILPSRTLYLGKKTVCTYEFYTKYPIRIPFGFKIELQERSPFWNFYCISTEEVEMKRTFIAITTEY